MQTYHKLLEQYYDLTNEGVELVNSLPEVDELLANIKEIKGDLITIKRVITYSGRRRDVERHLASRNLIGTRDLDTYTISEEFVDV